MPIGSYCSDQTLLSSSARTTSGQTNAIRVDEFFRISFYTNVSARNGTSPTMTISLEESPDNTNWYNLNVSTVISNTGDYRLTTDEATKYIRMKYVIQGTSASFTFSTILIGKSS